MVTGDHWTFYDLDSFPREDTGVLSVPYVRIELPGTFMKAVLRLAERTWRMLRLNMPEENYNRPRVELTLTAERMQRVCQFFGRGKGSVEIDMSDETREYLGQRIRESDKLVRKIDQVADIARNTTRGRHQTARLSLRKDWDGFDWGAYSPGSNGRCVMNGGIVDHGPKGSPDWSIHT